MKNDYITNITQFNTVISIGLIWKKYIPTFQWTVCTGTDSHGVLKLYWKIVKLQTNVVLVAKHVTTFCDQQQQQRPRLQQLRLRQRIQAPVSKISTFQIQMIKVDCILEYMRQF